jgi:hypothetical protein
MDRRTNKLACWSRPDLAVVRCQCQHKKEKQLREELGVTASHRIAIASIDSVPLQVGCISLQRLPPCGYLGWVGKHIRPRPWRLPNWAGGASSRMRFLRESDLPPALSPSPCLPAPSMTKISGVLAVFATW